MTESSNPRPEDLEWAKQALAPFGDISLTPEQERALALWEIPNRG